MTAWRLALAPLVAVLLVGASQDVRAADEGGYADSVDRSLQILRDAHGDDRDAARRAADVLEAGTGESQREILVELRQDPPDVAGARGRLSSLSRAARSPAFAPEPAKARSAVRDVLAQPRYAPLRTGPSLVDRIREWLQRVPWRRHPEALARGHGGPGVVRSEPDRFALADRLAAAGDLDGAVRALAGGVAVVLGGDRAWEASPLTVRELFARAPDARSLGPLLLAFEAAVYGRRPPDPEAYRHVLAAAAPFRPGARAAA